MARNGSGTYSLPVAPFTPGTTISSSDVNSDFSDIATALTGSIAADGQTAITGQLKGALGTAPTYSISGDLNTGFGSSTADTVFIQCGGVNVLTATASGVSITSVTSAITFSGGAGTPVTLYWNDASAAIGPNLIFTRDSASPAASDSIGAIFFNGNNSAAAAKSYSAIKTLITDATAASEDANLFLQTQVAGTLTTILQSSGADIAIPGNLTVTGNITGKSPTAQRLTSGSGATCTPTAGTVRWHVRMVGSGGGGGARITNSGVTGGNTTFGTWTAVGGSGGGSGTIGGGGAGGTGGTDGTGTLIYRVQGFDGMGSFQTTVANVTPQGGSGANSVLGSGAQTATGSAGASARNNSGGGGQGASGSASNNGAGGGSGEYVEFWVNNPTATTYTITAGGAGGSAGTQAGGNGGSGVIIVEEYYS